MFQMNFVLVLIYVLTSSTHTLGAEESFTALAIINILRFPVALCPFLVNGGVQVSVEPVILKLHYAYLAANVHCQLKKIKVYRC